jgi:ATP-dependent Lon protease
MSELSENLGNIKYLPIFPLPIALLPNELLPLHIFEPRYRKMLKDIQLENNFFGLSYFDAENSDSSLPEIDSFGCVAQVREAETLPDGRSNILTVGLIRYQLERYVEVDEPYLVAEITVFEDFEEDRNILQTIADEVFALFKRVAQAAHELSGARGSLPDIPQADPQMLSFLISAAFNLEPETKYEFMKMRSTTERLERLQGILKQAVEKIEASAEVNKIAKTNGHSKKKVDLDF